MTLRTFAPLVLSTAALGNESACISTDGLPFRLKGLFPRLQITVNSGVIALLFNIRVFNAVFQTENLLPFLIYAAFSLAFILNGPMLFLRYESRFKTVLYLLFIVTFLWLVSEGVELSNTYFLYGFAFAFPALFVTNLNFSIKRFYMFSMLFGLLLFFRVDGWGWVLEEPEIKMYNSYLILPFILASFIGLRYYVKNVFLSVLGIVNLLIYVPLFLGIGVRGTYVSLLIFTLLMMLRLNIVRKHSYIVGVSSAVLLAGFMLVDFELLFTWISQVLSDNDMQIYAVDKYLAMFSHGDVSNGRGELYADAFAGFLQSPVWGHGFGLFEQSHDGLYVHNIFLEVLYEGGVLLACIIFYPFYVYFRYLFSSPENDKTYIFLAFLFSVGVSKLFFSGILWNVPPFWLFAGYMFHPLLRKNE